MSELERNRGALWPVGYVDEMQEGMDGCEFSDWLEDRGLLRIGEKVYSVDWKVKSERDCTFFCDVNIDDCGLIHFHTMHYNGGGSLEEVLERDVKKIEGER